MISVNFLNYSAVVRLLWEMENEWEGGNWRVLWTDELIYFKGDFLCAQLTLKLFELYKSFYSLSMAQFNKCKAKKQSNIL